MKRERERENMKTIEGHDIWRVASSFTVDREIFTANKNFVDDHYRYCHP